MPGHPTRGAAVPKIGLVPTVWDERYHCPGAATWLSTRKQRDVVHQATATGLLELHDDADYDARLVWKEIARVHDSRFVNAVRKGTPRALAESQGFTWSLDLADAISRIWNGHLAASRLALETGLAFHPASGAHHAGRATGDGFCTFNYLVGAGRTLLEEGAVERVMIVDLDTHQGNGTFELTRDDDRFACFDISGSSFGVPQTDDDTAFYKMVGDDAEYFEALLLLPEMLDSFRPDLVQFQAGMDCHEDDDLGGVPGMTAARIAERDRFVFRAALKREIPVVFNLAGGYQEDGTTVRLHVETVRIAAESIVARASKTGMRRT